MVDLNEQSVRRVVLQLCQEALRGELTLDSFHSRWPEAALKAEFLAAVHDDIEDAVEHFPGHWWSGRRLVGVWETSEHAWHLRVDALLLAQECQESVLTRCRQRFVDASPVPPADLEAAIEECVKAG